MQKKSVSEAPTAGGSAEGGSETRREREEGVWGVGEEIDREGGGWEGRETWRRRLGIK